MTESKLFSKAVIGLIFTEFLAHDGLERWIFMNFDIRYTNGLDHTTSRG
jgi:hypothetical protein